MNRTRLIISCRLLISTLLLCGCDVYHMQLCPSYVSCYMNLRTISLEQVSLGSTNYIMIHPGNDIPIYYYHLNSSGKEKEVYDRLCRKHEDLNYNKYRSLPPHDLPPETFTYNDKDFTALEIVSDKDYDAGHPAGTDLADIVRFMSWSPYNFIRSGYSKYYHFSAGSLSESFKCIMRHIGYDWLMNDATCYPIDKIVKDLQKEDLILLGNDGVWNIGFLYFESQHAESGEHTITVKMTTDAGDILEDRIVMSFD